MQQRMESVSKRPIRRRCATRLVWRIFLGLFLVFGLLLGTGLGYIYFGSNTVQQMVRDFRQGHWNHEKAFPDKDEVTILFLGKDVDRDHRGRVVNTNARTDTILLARLNFTDKTASLLSIPRDTRVRIPGYRGKHKINAAHAYGGPELTMETIDEFLGIHPDQYVVVDYETFEKAIDLIGGLKIDVVKQMDYDDNWGNLHIHLKPGLQELNGDQALGYVRFRKSNDGRGDSDYDRIARQQQFLMAVKEKMMSPSTFLNLPRIIDTVHNGVNSSMSDAQLMAIARFVRSLPSTSIRTATLPGTEGRVYVAADDDAIRRLVQEMFY